MKLLLTLLALKNKSKPQIFAIKLLIKNRIKKYQATLTNVYLFIN